MVGDRWAVKAAASCTRPRRALRKESRPTSTSDWLAPAALRSTVQGQSIREWREGGRLGRQTGAGAGAGEEGGEEGEDGRVGVDGAAQEGGRRAGVLGAPEQAYHGLPVSHEEAQDLNSVFPLRPSLAEIEQSDLGKSRRVGVSSQGARRRCQEELQQRVHHDVVPRETSRP